MLQVRGLTASTALLQLTDISFVVNKGETVALIGPNGGGKSAVLTHITDPEVDYQGNVVANHFNSHGGKDKFQMQIGYLPQNFSPPLHLTGYEFLEIIGTLYQLPQKTRTTRIKQLAKQLACQKDIYFIMERISPAVRQKIGIIAAILAEPPIIIMDEPLTFLDFDAQLAVKEIISDQVDKGTSVLIATNNLQFAEEITDNFVIIRNGEVVADGTLAQLSHQAQSAKNLPAIYKELAVGD